MYNFYFFLKDYDIFLSNITGLFLKFKRYFCKQFHHSTTHLE